MANKNLFQTLAGALLPQTDARQQPSARRPTLLSRSHALAQYAATGCLERHVLRDAPRAARDRAARCATACRAPSSSRKTAVYCRERGYMKDMPALLCALLRVHATPALLRARLRPRDRQRQDAAQLRADRPLGRQVGRKSLGSAPKRLVQRWFGQRTDEKIFRRRSVRRRRWRTSSRWSTRVPATASRARSTRYLIGRPYDARRCRRSCSAFEAYKRGAAASCRTCRSRC